MKTKTYPILLALLLMGCNSAESPHEKRKALSYEELLKERKNIRAQIESKESSNMMELLEIRVGDDEDRYMGKELLIKNNAVEARFKDFIVVSEFLTASNTVIDRDTNVFYSIVAPGDSLRKHFKFKPEGDKRSFRHKLINATFVPNDELTIKYEFVPVE